MSRNVLNRTVPEGLCWREEAEKETGKISTGKTGSKKTSEDHAEAGMTLLASRQGREGTKHRERFISS